MNIKKGQRIMKSFKKPGSFVLGVFLVMQVTAGVYGQESVQEAGFPEELHPVLAAEETTSEDLAVLEDTESGNFREPYEEKILDITPNFAEMDIKGFLGDRGYLEILPVHGIEVTGGSFRFAYTLNNAILGPDGGWEAVGVGKSSVPVLYTYSEETLDRIKKAYPGYELRINEIAPMIGFDFEEDDLEYLDITPRFSVSTVNGNVGDAGFITVLPVYGIEVTGGTFHVRPRDTSIISLSDDGHWRAVQGGSETIYFSYTYSQETLTKIVEKFPNRQLITTKMEDSVTFSIAGVNMPPLAAMALLSDTNMSGVVHVQELGWMTEGRFGDVLGTTGQGRRMEAVSIRILPDANEVDGGIEYRSHIQSKGWESAWRADGEVSGSSGNAERVEAIQIRLTGALAEKYDLVYSVHVQGQGWTVPVKNGDIAGTVGQGRRLEALQVIIVPK